jgi:hypothetical protein
MEAIGHGLTILSWYEAYPEKDVPPENIWDDVFGTGTALEDREDAI